MGLIYKANGEKYIPDREPISVDLWAGKLAELCKRMIFNDLTKISELRESCGVKSKGKDRIIIGRRNGRPIS